MSSVAEQLRAARESRKLTIHQVAEATKIRTDHLRALEEGNFNVFSAPVYIRGSVKCYAALLKLDAQEVMAALDAELAGTEKFSEPPPLSEREKGVVDFITLQLSKVDWRRGVVILATLAAVVAVVAGISLWLHHRNADPLSDLKPEMYRPAKSGNAEKLPLPSPAHSR